MPMNIDNDLDIENFAELQPLADPTIALEFLLTAKDGVRNLAIAVTEAGTPAVKTLLQTQLQQAISLHEDIASMMVQKGWVHPYDLNEQVALDIISAQAVLKVASLDLFPPMPPTNAPGNTNKKEANELGN